MNNRLKVIFLFTISFCVGVLLLTFGFFSEAQAPYLRVISPSSGETWLTTEAYQIKWESSGVEKIGIALYRTGEIVGVIARNINANKGAILWKPTRLEERYNYWIGVYQYPWNYGLAVDYSDGPFSIIEEVIPLPPSPTVTGELDADQMKQVLEYVSCGGHYQRSDPDYIKTNTTIYCPISAGFGASWNVILLSPCGPIARQGASFMQNGLYSATVQDVFPGACWDVADAAALLTALKNAITNQADAPYVFANIVYNQAPGINALNCCHNQLGFSRLWTVAWPPYGTTVGYLLEEVREIASTYCGQQTDSFLTANSGLVQECSDYNYSQCQEAFALFIPLYISQWGVPMLVDDFLEKVRQLRGDQGVEDARWAIENILEIEAKAPPKIVASTVATNIASSILTNQAQLNGYLADLGEADSSNVWFEWGETTSYGNKTTHVIKDTIGSFKEIITGLSPSTTHHFRTVAENSGGISYGEDRSFTTPSPPLNADQMKLALEYVFCNRYLGDSGLDWAIAKVACAAIETLGPSAPIVLASPCGSLIGAGSNFRKECANAAVVGLPSEVKGIVAAELYYPTGYGPALAAAAIDRLYQIQRGAAYNEVMLNYYECVVSYALGYFYIDWDCVKVKAPHLYEAYHSPPVVVSWEELKEKVAVCCEAKIAAYTATLTDAQLKPCADHAHSQCIKAHAQIISAYISVWGAVLSANDFLEKVRQIRGDQGVEDARWAIENIMGIEL